MEVRRISIFLENRVGRLAEAAGILGDAGIDILAISVADTADFGILRLLVNDVEKALKVLKEHKIVCKQSRVSVVSVDGVPGGLAKVLRTINDNNLNIEYMYAASQKSAPNPLMVFRFPDADAATATLEKAGIKTISEEELLA